MHNALVRYTLTKIGRLDKPEMSKILYLTGNLVEAYRYRLDLGVAEDIHIDIQVGSDLGERLVNALERKFDEGFGKVIFIGTDTPLLTREAIAEAVAQLSECEVVIGPTMDGGYYLIGFSVSIPAILKGIAWGTPQVYQQTVDLMQFHQVRWKSLKLGSDVDTFEDLRAVWGVMADSPQFTNCHEGNELFEVVRKLVGH